MLVHMLATDHAATTRQHNGLVITTQLVTVTASNLFFKSAKITAQVGTTKFIIKSRRTQRAIQHNIQRRGNTRRFAMVCFPRLNKLRYAQIGY